MPHTQAELITLAESVLLRNYRQQPMVLQKALGAEMWDVAGKRYLDMTAGIAVCGLGHSHPGFVARMQEQLGRLTQVSNLYYNEMQILAAAEISRRAFGGRVFFANSGAEANEAALKLARRYQAVVQKAPHKQKIISTIGSFHGRSIATVSVTGQAKYRDGFGDLWGPVEFVPFGDLAALEKALAPGDACAFLVEPIQAEGGIIVAPPGYLAEARALCSRTGALLLFDEVQTGVGRTGKWFGCEHDGVIPDVMTLAKGLGGGIPIGAIVATEAAAQGLTFVAGSAVPHANTFGGNALSCAAALAVLQLLEQEGLLAKVTATGDYLAARLGELKDKHPQAKEVRGRGLLRGLLVEANALALVGNAREAGLLLSVAGDAVIRFAPPFVVTKPQIDEACSILDNLLSAGGGKAA